MNSKVFSDKYVNDFRNKVFMDKKSPFVLADIHLKNNNKSFIKNPEEYIKIVRYIQNRISKATKKSTKVNKEYIDLTNLI